MCRALCQLFVLVCSYCRKCQYSNVMMNKLFSILNSNIGTIIRCVLASVYKEGFLSIGPLARWSVSNAFIQHVEIRILAEYSPSVDLLVSPFIYLFNRRSRTHH